MAKKRKVHSLTGRITLPLVYVAWKAVRRNRGAAGIDKVSIKMFEANLDENIEALMRDLKKGSFEPKPLRRVYIPKDAKRTKFRPLGIPAVRDRVAQEVLRRLFQAYLDDPREIPPPTWPAARGDSLPRRVADYLAGMTDRYALERYRARFGEVPESLFG